MQELPQVYQRHSGMGWLTTFEALETQAALNYSKVCIDVSSYIEIITLRQCHIFTLVPDDGTRHSGHN